MGTYKNIIETDRKCIFCDKPVLTTTSNSLEERERKIYCSSDCRKLHSREEYLKKRNRFTSFKK